MWTTLPQYTHLNYGFQPYHPQESTMMAECIGLRVSTIQENSVKKCTHTQKTTVCGWVFPLFLQIPSSGQCKGTLTYNLLRCSKTISVFRPWDTPSLPPWVLWCILTLSDTLVLNPGDCTGLLKSYSGTASFLYHPFTFHSPLPQTPVLCEVTPHVND